MITAIGLGVLALYTVAVTLAIIHNSNKVSGYTYNSKEF
jgi:hypothetical protein